METTHSLISFFLLLIIAVQPAFFSHPSGHSFGFHVSNVLLEPSLFHFAVCNFLRDDGNIDISEVQDKVKNFRLKKIAANQYECAVDKCKSKPKFNVNGVNAILHFIEEHTHPYIEPFKCIKCSAKFRIHKNAVAHARECVKDKTTRLANQYTLWSSPQKPQDQSHSAKSVLRFDTKSNELSPVSTISVGSLVPLTRASGYLGELNHFNMIDISYITGEIAKLKVRKKNDYSYECTIEDCEAEFRFHGVEVARHFVEKHISSDAKPFKCNRCHEEFKKHELAVEHVDKCFGNSTIQSSRQSVLKPISRNQLPSVPYERQADDTTGKAQQLAERKEDTIQSPKKRKADSATGDAQPPKKRKRLVDITVLNDVDQYCRSEYNLISKASITDIIEYLDTHKIFMCPQCGTNLEYQSRVKHILSHPFSIFFKCQLCSLAAKPLEELVYHLRQSHFPAERMLTAAKVFRIHIADDRKKQLREQESKEQEILSDAYLQNFLTVNVVNQNSELPDFVQDNISLSSDFKARHMPDPVVHACKICRKQLEDKMHAIWHLRFDHSLKSIIDFERNYENIIVIEDDDFNNQVAEPSNTTSTILSNASYSANQKPSPARGHAGEEALADFTHQDPIVEPKLGPTVFSITSSLPSISEFEKGISEPSIENPQFSINPMHSSVPYLPPRNLLSRMPPISISPTRPQPPLHISESYARKQASTSPTFVHHPPPMEPRWNSRSLNPHHSSYVTDFPDQKSTGPVFVHPPAVEPRLNTGQGQRRTHQNMLPQIWDLR